MRGGTQAFRTSSGATRAKHLSRQIGDIVSGGEDDEICQKKDKRKKTKDKRKKQKTKGKKQKEKKQKEKKEKKHT